MYIIATRDWNTFKGRAIQRKTAKTERMVRVIPRNQGASVVMNPENVCVFTTYYLDGVMGLCGIQYQSVGDADIEAKVQDLTLSGVSVE